MDDPFMLAKQAEEFDRKSMMLCVTINSEDRQRANLATTEVHQCLRRIWSRDIGWRVHRYLIMPNHLHFFVTPGERPISLTRWMRQWTNDCYYGSLMDPVLLRLDFRDSPIYTREQYDEFWAFIRQNPMRHALVTDVDAWPYQGEIIPFIWAAQQCFGR